jgi:hypothetical protein
VFETRTLQQLPLTSNPSNKFDNSLIFLDLQEHSLSTPPLGIQAALKLGMEKEKIQKEEEKMKEILKDLRKELHEDLKVGRYYGVDQKIRNIQKAFSLSYRI